jgi:hypothetical protein
MAPPFPNVHWQSEKNESSHLKTESYIAARVSRRSALLTEIEESMNARLRNSTNDEDESETEDWESAKRNGEKKRRELEKCNENEEGRARAGIENAGEGERRARFRWRSVTFIGNFLTDHTESRT